MMKYNTNLKLLSTSQMSLYQENLSKIKDILLLTYGESDLPVNKEIKSALINSLLDNHDKYCSSYGLLSLRKNIANKLNKQYDLNYNYENIIIFYKVFVKYFFIHTVYIRHYIHCRHSIFYDTISQNKYTLLNPHKEESDDPR